MAKKPPFDPSRPYKVVADESGIDTVNPIVKKPPFDPNKPYEVVDNNIDTNPSGRSLKKEALIRDYFNTQKLNRENFKNSLTDVDASDSEKDYLADMYSKGATPQEIDEAKLTLQGKNPVQDGGRKYYLQDSGKGYKSIVPINDWDKVPNGAEMSNIWGTQAEANDDNRLTDIAKKAYNILPNLGGGVNDLTNLVYGTITGEDAPWYHGLKNAVSNLSFKTSEEYQKNIGIKTENINDWTDVLKVDNWDLSPSAIANTLVNGLQTVGEFALGAGALSKVGKAATIQKEFEAGKITSEAAKKLLKRDNYITGMVASSIVNSSEAMDKLNELDIKGNGAFAMGLLTTIAVSGVEQKFGLEGQINKLFKRETGETLVNKLVVGAAEDMNGNVTKEGLNTLFETATAAATAVAESATKKLLKTAGGEAFEEVSQNAISKAMRVLYDNFADEENSKYGEDPSDLISPEYFAELFNDGLAGALVGAGGHIASRPFDKNEAKSKTIMEAIGKGDEAVTELKTELAAALKRGDISQEDYDKGIFRTDMYKQYNEAIKGRDINDYAKRNVFDLTYEKANAEEGIKDLENRNPDGINDVAIAEKKQRVKELQGEIEKFWKENPTHDEKELAEKVARNKANEEARYENDKIKEYEYKPLLTDEDVKTVAAEVEQEFSEKGQPLSPEQKQAEIDKRLNRLEYGRFNELGDDERKFLQMYNDLQTGQIGENGQTVGTVTYAKDGKGNTRTARVKVGGKWLNLSFSDLQDLRLDKNSKRIDNSALLTHNNQNVILRTFEDEDSGRIGIGVFDMNGKPIVNSEGKQFSIRATREGAGMSQFTHETHLSEKGKASFEGIPIADAFVSFRHGLENQERNEDTEKMLRGKKRNPSDRRYAAEAYKSFVRRVTDGLKQMIAEANDGTVLFANSEVMNLAQEWLDKNMTDDQNELSRDKIIGNSFGHEHIITIPLAKGGRMLIARNAETEQHEKDQYRGYSEPLSERGKNTAKLLAAKLKSLGAKHVITSPQTRSKQTALITKRYLDGENLDINVPVAPKSPVAPSGGNENLSDNNKNTNLAENGEQGQQQETISTGRSGSATLGEKSSDRGNSETPSERQIGSQEDSDRTQSQAKQPRKRSTKPRKLRSPELIRASKLDVFSAKEAVLQWFINGGKIQRGSNENPVGLRKLFSSNTELNKRISLTSKKGYNSLDGIAEAVQTKFIEDTGNDTIPFSDFHDAVNEVLNDHESISSMAKELLTAHNERNFNPREEAFIDEENAPENAEENDISVDLSDARNDLADESLTQLANDQPAYDSWLADQDTNQFGSEDKIDDEASDIQQYDGDIQFQKGEQIENNLVDLAQEVFADYKNGKGKLQLGGSFKTLVGRIRSGDSALTRLDSEAERGGISKNGKLEESRTLLAIHRSANRKAIQSEGYSTTEEELLKQYAQQTGAWLSKQEIADNSLQTDTPILGGQEADVYVSKDRKTITKVVNYRFFNDSPLHYLDNRIALHNHLFEGTPYELLGFTEDEHGFAFVISQPFIDGKELDTGDLKLNAEQQVKLDKYMQDTLGMKRVGRIYYNEDYIIDDLHLGNVMYDKNGEFKFIDTVPHLNTKEIGLKGVREYNESGDIANNDTQLQSEATTWRDSHTAPRMGYETLEEALEKGDDFNLSEVARGYHNQPNDYFDTKVGPRYYMYDNPIGKESLAAINNIQQKIKTAKDRKKLTVKVYRAVPNDVSADSLINGDWVTFSKNYAIVHGENRFGEGEYKIIEQEVPIKDVWWDGNDINEWGYDNTNKTRFQKENQIAKPNRFQKITQEQFRKLLNRLKRAFPKVKINVLSSKELGDVLGENWDKVQKQAVWHGSPHSFDKFSTSKIGTGEGNQAFGYGLYFTDLKEIAEDYADRLRKNKILIGGKTFDEVSSEIGNEPALSWVEIWHNDGYSKEQIIQKLEDELKDTKRLKQFDWIKPSVTKVLDYIKNKELKNDTSNRNLYKVKIHGDKTIGELNFLEWDKIVPDKILDDLGSKLIHNGKPLRKLFDDSKEFEKTDGTKVKGDKPKGLLFYKRISQILGGDKAASEWLLKNGIDGIRYPAESISRGATSDNARGFNYVVFDENAIEIDEKIQFLKDKNNHVYGFVKDGQVYINGETLNANTPIHEFGHVWTNMLKGANPALYKKGLDLVKDTKYYDRIKKNKNYANLTEEQILEEALVTAIGDRGEAFLTAGSKSKFREWLQKLKEFLTDKFFINQKGKLDNLTLDQFLDGALGDILGGKEIQTRQDKKEEERAKIVSEAKKNGTYLKAPNGKPTNLTPEQWVTVRTKNFIRWYGNWQNDPENASQVKDENGEPLVVYHGTNEEFTEFKNGFHKNRFYFTSDKELAASYGNKNITVFLNIKNPKIINNDSSEFADTFNDDSLTISNDGVIYNSKTEKGEPINAIIVFNPNQIKSATSNNGDFSEETGNINFQIVGEKAAKTRQNLTDSLNNAKDMDEDKTLSTKYVLYDKLNGVSKEFKTKQGAENYLNTSGTTINGKKISKANSVIKEVSKELQIKLKTGWEKVHGSWWYETDDNNTTFKNAKELADSILNVADNTQTLVGKLGDLLNAEELFSLYPELTKVDVYLNTNNLLPESSNATYSEKTNSIHINARRLQRLYSDNGQHSDTGGLGGTHRNVRPEDLEYSLASGTLKGKIIHEIQHAVQTQENWYRGTGVVQVEKYLKQQGYEKYSMPKKQWDSLVYHTYLRWAGENQAHAAEIRNKRTEEQRRETLLSENEPIERALQILERGDNPIQFQFESAEDMEDESESEENEEEKSNYFQKAVKQFGKFTPASKEYAIKKRHGVSIRKLEEELLGGNLTEERREEIEKLLEQYQDEYESFRDDVDTLKDLLEESRNVEDIPLEDLIKYATTIELYDDLNNNAYFKDVQFRIAQHIFNKRMAELEKIQAESGRNLHLGQAKFRDMSKSDIMLKALSDVQHYFPELQEFAKMWDEVVQNYQDEARRLSKEHNRLGKEVIKEDRAKQGLAPVRIWRWITQDNSHHFSWLNENGKLITEAQARAKGYSQTRLDYLKNYREIKKHFASEQDKTRVLYDDLTLPKSKTNFPETLKGEGLLAAVQGYMYNFNGKVEEVVIKYGNDFKTLAEVNEDLQKQAKRGLLSKPMAYIKSMYYGMKAMKYYAKRVNEDGSKMPDINYASNYSLSQTNRITNQFGSEYKNEKFTQDFHQTMLHYINDMSFSKNVSPIMPVLNSIQYYNENKIFGKEKKENVAKFLEYWKEKHIFQENKVLLPQADWAMRTLRHWTSLLAMSFNLKAGTWNVATGKYNAWREDGLKNAVIGEKRFLSNPNKTRAIMENFSVYSHEDIRDFKTGLGNGLAKLSRIFSSWGEYYIQSVQFLSQIEESDFKNINDKGEYEGTEEEQKAFKEKARKYKKHIQDVQGKYATHERRNYELWEMGRFMGQFKTWIPDWFINRFGERSEGVYGEQGGSWRYISDGIKQISKDMSVKEFFTSKKPEYKAMRRNLYDALTIALLLTFRYGGDDDEDKRRKATKLGQAAENLLFIYDPHTWEYTLTNPAAGVRTTKLFLQAIGDLATGERYKTGERKGELKGIQEAKRILPYNKISTLDEQFEKLRGEDD